MVAGAGVFTLARLLLASPPSVEGGGLDLQTRRIGSTPNRSQRCSTIFMTVAGSGRAARRKSAGGLQNFVGTPQFCVLLTQPAQLVGLRRGRPVMPAPSSASAHRPQFGPLCPRPRQQQEAPSHRTPDLPPSTAFHHNVLYRQPTAEGHHRRNTRATNFTDPMSCVVPTRDRRVPARAGLCVRGRAPTSLIESFARA